MPGKVISRRITIDWWSTVDTHGSTRGKRIETLSFRCRRYGKQKTYPLIAHDGGGPISAALRRCARREPECGSDVEAEISRRHPSPAARAIKNKPAPTTTAPMARATRSPAGARRSTVMAAATTAIARRSMTPMTRRITIRPAQQ